MSGQQAIPGAARVNAFWVAPEKLQIPGLDKPAAKGSALADRRRLDQPPDQGLVQSMTSDVGWLKGSVVLARKNGDDVEVVDGRGRVRAARAANIAREKLGKPAILCLVIVMRGDDSIAWTSKMLGNEHRREVNFIDRAEQFLSATEHGWHTIETLALVYARPAVWIKQHLAIAELPPEVREMGVDGRLTFTALAKLTAVPRERQVEAAKEAAAAGGTVTAAANVAGGIRDEVRTGGSRPAGTRPRANIAQAAPGRKLLKRLAADETLADVRVPIPALLAWLTGQAPATSIPELASALARVESERTGTESETLDEVVDKVPEVFGQPPRVKNWLLDRVKKGDS